MAPAAPYKLVTVNNAPDRAKRLVGRVLDDMKDNYAIDYVANAESESHPAFVNFACHLTDRPPGPEAAKLVLEEHVPDIVVCLLFFFFSYY